MEDRKGKITRYAVLDSYRFLAASGVVLYHFENHFQPFLSFLTSYLERFQHFVDFFFVLSGFIIMHVYGGKISSWGDFVGFMRRRFARLYPLHFAVLLVACMTGIFVLAFKVRVRDPSFFDFSLVPSNLVLTQAWGVTNRPGLNEPSWSLSAEMFVYLLFPILVILLKKMGPVRTIIFAVILASGVEWVRARLGLRPNDVATYDFGIFRALPAFLMGMATCVIVESQPAKPVGWVAPHLVALLVFVAMLAKAPPYAIIALFPVLVGLVARAERGGRPTFLGNKYFVVLGNASFAIYITHTIFQIISVHIVRLLNITEPVGLMAIATIFYCIIVACGVLSYYYFETPMRRLLDGSRRAAAVSSRAAIG